MWAESTRSVSSRISCIASSSDAEIFPADFRRINSQIGADHILFLRESVNFFCGNLRENFMLHHLNLIFRTMLTSVYISLVTLSTRLP